MKVFFDNNLSPHMPRAVAAASVAERIVVSHLRDMFPPNAADSLWLGELSREGGWSIVSGDRRVRSRPEERAAWRQAGLTTFFLLQKGWHASPYWEIVWRFFRWWPTVVEQAQRIQPGAAFEVPFVFRQGQLKQLPV